MWPLINSKEAHICLLVIDLALVLVPPCLGTGVIVVPYTPVNMSSAFKTSGNHIRHLTGVPSLINCLSNCNANNGPCFGASYDEDTRECYLLDPGHLYQIGSGPEVVHVASNQGMYVLYPTRPFTILEPQDHEIGELLWC